MTKQAEKAESKDNQGLHHMESAHRLLMEAAVELGLANMPGAAKIIRNSAGLLTRSIAAAKQAQQVEAAGHLLAATDQRLGSVRPGPEGLIVGSGDLALHTPRGANFPQRARGGVGTPPAPPAGVAIYSDDRSEKKATASGGTEEEKAQCCS